jgi:hypothetical protein
MALMKISKRTAQDWRDKGMITFSQVGNKFYCRMEDIELMVLNHQKKAFKASPRRNH